MAAVIKGIQGDHDAAAADLEGLVPLACKIARHDPEAFAATLNSYAVKLGELGHVEQALNVASRIALFAPVVPQIRETIPELQSKLTTRKHSVVVIHRPSEPVAMSHAEAKWVRKRARQSTFLIRDAELSTSLGINVRAGLRARPLLEPRVISASERFEKLCRPTNESRGAAGPQPKQTKKDPRKDAKIGAKIAEKAFPQKQEVAGLLCWSVHDRSELTRNGLTDSPCGP